MKNIIFIIFFTLTAAACNYSEKDLVNNKISIIFSHNIQGVFETCGCDDPPLGGQAQAYGLINSKKITRKIVYVDAGDTFFGAPKIPKYFHKSQTQIATDMANVLKNIGLDYFTPGEMDFALGGSFLENLAKKANTTIVLSNYIGTDLSTVKYKIISVGNNKIYLIGIIDPNLIISKKIKKDFLDPYKAITNFFKEIFLNDSDRVIVISHSENGYDKNLAAFFPRLNWIISSHSSSLTKRPITINQTKIVQLSNIGGHLGEILIDISLPPSQDQFILHPVIQSYEQAVSSNPVTKLIKAHKKKILAIEKMEEDAMK